MHTSLRFILGSAAALALASAHATAPADAARITNGGTGYIGLTASAGSPRQAVAMADTTMALPSGEASTMVQGRPNAHPIAERSAPMASAVDAQAAPASTAVMGAAPAARMQHPMWGTPD